MSTFVYHPPTVDSLDIEASPDGLGVRIGIYNATDNGTYTSIEVMNRDVHEVIRALRAALRAALCDTVRDGACKGCPDCMGIPA